MPKEDIQGNSWTDEPEIPNEKHEQEPRERAPDSDAPTLREGPAAEQRPPSDS